MNGFFGFAYTFAYLYGAMLKEIRQQFLGGRGPAMFIGRRADDRRRVERRSAARRAHDVPAPIALPAAAVSEAKVVYLRPAGTSGAVYPRSARMLTANPTDALTLNIDQEAVLWLSRQDEAYQQRLNRLLRQQMRRARS
jgi:uncharacterized protein (DUF4415 family)